MPEPLKGKIKEVWITLKNPDEEDVVVWFKANVVFRKDLKSAVQGLLEDINKSYGCVHHREIGGDDDCLLCVAIGQTLDYVKSLIKKWFPDEAMEDG